jgi:3',5'-cyclic-AMP phosphodiesterase
VSRSSRRHLLQAGGAAAVAGMISKLPPTSAHPVGHKRRLRIAHLTDIHVQPQRAGGEGMAAALRHAQQQKPDLILNGGDAVYDVFDAPSDDRVKQQAELWKAICRVELSVEMLHCIGNHDVLHGKTAADTIEPKKWPRDLFGLPERYYSVDRGGWHLVILDSTYVVGGVYKAYLDDAQYDWLARDLANTPADRPVLVVTHIPILTVTSFLDGENEKTGNWVVPGAWMHLDARRFKDLFRKHPNVKLCLSGHEHLVDRCEYLGVTYICDGAVCAGWWKGPYQECEYGYGLIDLYPDGTFEHQYVTYGWKTRE